MNILDYRTRPIYCKIGKELQTQKSYFIIDLGYTKCYFDTFITNLLIFHIMVKATRLA